MTSARALLVEFLRNERGAGAAEFALVVPVLLLFILGTIDVGLYAWNINRLEKATQLGTRWAVATDMVPSGLASYSFAVSGGIEQGTVVPITAFPGVDCTSTACTCASGGSCAFAMTHNTTAFNAIVTRMQDAEPRIAASNVTVDYAWSGLGYAGDPNGPDVSPIVTVEVTGMTFRPITGLLFGATVSLPQSRYSLTAEDSEGTVSN